MGYPTRIYYTEKDKALMWDRWQILNRAGGIRPLPRRRSRLSLTLAERKEISRGLSAGRSLRTIATTLGRSPSTVSRELNRNGGRRGR